MKRGYNTRQFLEAVARIRGMWPQAAFTTDVIVGFPGETEAEFQETLDFCEQVGFSRLHVFPYSPREGTPAATMDGQVDEAVKAQRVHWLIALGDNLSAATARASLARWHRCSWRKRCRMTAEQRDIPPNISTYVHRMAGPARWRWCGLTRLPKKEWRVRLQNICHKHHAKGED